MTAPIISLFVAASVWGLIVALRGSVPVMCAVYLVAASVLGVQFLDINVGASLSIDRLVLLALFGTFGMRLVTRKHTPKPISALEVTFGVFLVVLVANTLLHDWRFAEPGQVPILPHLIEGYLIPAALYGIARQSISRQSDLDGFYAVTILFGVYLALTACLEMAQMWPFVFPRYIADPQIGIHFGRARGPFLNSVRLGIYLSLALGMTWITLLWRGVWGRTGHLLGLALCGLFAAAIGLTYTRSVWLGVAVAGLVVSLMTFRGIPRRAVIVVTLFAVLLVGLMGQQLTAFKREYTAQDTAQSTKMRAVFAYVSWLMFQERPLTGFGFGHYQHENRPYLNDRSTDLQLQTVRGYVHHNTLLSMLVELGLLGLVPFVITVTLWCRTGWCLWRDTEAPHWIRGQAVLFLAIAGVIFCQMVFHDITYSVVENGAFFCCAGLLSGLASMRQVSWARPLRIELVSPREASLQSA